MLTYTLYKNGDGFPVHCSTYQYDSTSTCNIRNIQPNHGIQYIVQCHTLGIIICEILKYNINTHQPDRIPVCTTSNKRKNAHTESAYHSSLNLLISMWFYGSRLLVY